MLTQKLTLSYFSKLALQFVQMVTSFVVARIVGPDVLGVLAYGLAFVSMFQFIADLGTGTAYVKLYASGYDKNKCFGTYVRIRIALVVLFSAIVIIIYFGKKGYNFNINSFSIQDYVVVIYLLINIVSLLYSAFTATWTARTEQAKMDITHITQVILYQIFRLILAVLGFKAIAIATSNLVAVIIVAPLYFILGKDIKLGKFDKSIALKMIGLSLPVILLIFFRTLYQSLDKVLLKQFSNTMELGYYSAANAFAIFIRTIEQSAGLLFFPFFSKAIADNNIDLINNSINKFERFSFAFILPCVSIISIMSDKIIYLTYGKGFLPSAGILRLIIPTFFISLVILPYGNIIAGKGLFYLAAFCQGISFIFFLSFAYLFVGKGAITQKGEGMAFALLIGTVVMAILFYFYSKRNVPKLKILPAKKGLLFASVYSILMFILYQHGVESAGFAINILFIVVFIGLYLSFGYMFKTVGKEEYALITNIINLKKMKNYITSELITSDKSSSDKNDPIL